MRSSTCHRACASTPAATAASAATTIARSGPRLGTFGLGANNVITASTEFEHYFTPQWGGAVFVDSGSAFNGRTPDWHTGVGVGLRWRSPVGPVRVDIAHGLDQPDSAFTINLNIGADL